MSNNPIRVLIVDDEPTSRSLMQAVLLNAGCQVSLAVNGEDALRQLRANPCDIVTLDVEMTGMNGYQVCAALRAAAGSELSIVMLTGMDDVDSIQHAFDAGATDFITKPINWSLLWHRVQYLFRSHLALRELRTAHAHNAAILNAIPDLLFEIDLDGRYLDYRAPRIELLGAPAADLRGKMISEVLPPDAAEACLSALREAHVSGFSSGTQFGLQLGPKKHWFELSVSRKSTDSVQKPTFIVLSREITERKEAEHRIERLAYFDSLTGLPNRLSFFEKLQRGIERAQIHGNRLAVLFMDLDGFKNINDTLGHSTGDLVLRWVADQLRLRIRPTDTVSRLEADGPEIGLARLGGDEFTLMMPNLLRGEDALLLAHRIRELIGRPFHLEGHEVVLTASVGIAVYPDDGECADGLLKNADTAMYHAKSKGRDNCQFYSASLTEQAMQRLQLESNLRLALERDEFFLVYQPQLDLASGRICSVEALIRWNHPKLGLVSPATFIPLAEETGLVVPIGEWVLRTACAQAARWHAGGHALRVAVNLSPIQFRNPGLLGSVIGILDDGLAPELLELEITEGALMENTDLTLATLRALRNTGVWISLDDFGTGYSSMSYLTRLPLNMIKVDQSFVRGLPDDRESLTIVRAIVSLAKNLGFAVTAEGVETLEQARILHGLSCDKLQGYYFSKPVLPGQIPALLEKQWCLEDCSSHQRQPEPTNVVDESVQTLGRLAGCPCF